MDKDSPHRNHPRESRPPAGRERILDRKIEKLAMPASFSSNLARKAPNFGVKTPNGSVRFIVSLFEKSASLSDSPTPYRPKRESGASDINRVRGETKGRPVIHNNKNDNQRTSMRPRDSQEQCDRLAQPRFPLAQVGSHVEEYSLTLLRHKSYFNNRSLARCLDEDLENGTETKVRVVRSRKGVGWNDVENENDRDKDDQGWDKKGDMDIIPTHTDLSVPVQQPDSSTSNFLPSQLPEPSETDSETRSLPQINDFWSRVRAQLQVDEDEIYGTGRDQMRRSGSVKGPEEGSESRDLKPSTSAASTPFCCQPEPYINYPLPLPPVRPPPHVPVVVRRSSFSTSSSQWEQDSTVSSLEPFPDASSDYFIWDEPLQSSLRESTLVSDGIDVTGLLLNQYPEPKLPLLENGISLPSPSTEPSHSRYPSSSGSGSGPWIRPPTWRSPSSLCSSSPPLVTRVLPLAAQSKSHYHNCANDSRNRHQHQANSSKPSVCTTTTAPSARNIAVTDSIRRANDGSGSQRTPSNSRAGQTSTNSSALRSTHADSGTALSSSWSSFAYRPELPRRRLTTEEKLSEIDDFLGSEPEQELEPGWSGAIRDHCLSLSYGDWI
ncbi:hypothetical protein C7999DRAFT_43492 [Corynascus novoguineensis]|uniref:Uncharacterized protein n=1 Tax=Corynascus novoguineensis TaxID=1126955 RepID=A0AAN7CNB4_9PEZI|nr:hypothetical protein C7999DRAFT_43492 [Corynascus novoguineensis]